jgi:hypothetical protein
MTTSTSIDRRGCPARHHGTYTDYRYGCRCPDACEDNRIYQKRYRLRRLTPRRVDPTGTIRRIQALMAAGHNAAAIARAASLPGKPVRADSIQHLTSRRRDTRQATVLHTTATAVRRAFNTLVDQPGQSPRTAQRAADNDWVTADRWVGADIDDPDATPPGSDPQPDNEIVDRVLAGHARSLDGGPLDIRDVDRDEVVRRLILQGRPGAAARLLNVSGHTAKALVQQVVRGACLTEPAKSEAS